jgi:hypothetical protein
VSHFVTSQEQAEALAKRSVRIELEVRKSAYPDPVKDDIIQLDVLMARGEFQVLDDPISTGIGWKLALRPALPREAYANVGKAS